MCCCPTGAPWISNATAVTSSSPSTRKTERDLGGWRGRYQRRRQERSRHRCCSDCWHGSPPAQSYIGQFIVGGSYDTQVGRFLTGDFVSDSVPLPTPTPTPPGQTPTPTPTPTPVGQTPTPTPTPTPVGQTPTPTPTPTPVGQTPTPTATASPSGLTQGDVDCNGDVSSVDALKELRYVAQLSVSQNEPYPDIGEDVAPRSGATSTAAGSAQWMR
jgi:hypothetical protein